MKYARLLALLAALFALQVLLWQAARHTPWWVFGLCVTAGGLAWEIGKTEWRRRR